MMRKLMIGLIVLVVGQGEALAQVSLDSCRRMAIANNKEIIQQQIKIEQAGYQRKQAEAAYLPSLDFEGGYIFNQKKLSLVDQDQLLPTKSFNPATGTYDFNLLTDPATGMPIMNNGQPIPSQVALLPKSALTYDVHNVFAASLTLTQPIYMGGKIRAMNNITHYAEQLAQSMHSTKVQDVVYSVDEAYWRVVSLVAKQKLAESYLKLVKNLDDDVQKMINQGVATRANKLTVDVKVNEANVALAKVNNGVELSRMALNQLCGLPIHSRFTLEDENKKEVVGSLHATHVVMDSVYARRHEIRSLELAAKIYDEKAKVAKSEMLPQVAAFAAYHASNPNSYNGFENKFGFAFSMGAMVKVPLWHWGGLSNKYKEALAESRLQKVKIEDAREKISLQVNQATFRYEEAWKTFDKTKSNLIEANENLRCSQLAFREGVANLETVIAAQTAWLQACSENIDAQIDILLCDVYLSKVMGEMKY
ncbi:MAG: TolC family protein [bacterium]|nr:TolC family protein [bacterium]MDD6901082.1 TolC family protein [bacterium]MDY4185218.1 TolC family protein [Sodaliphilus sp.]